MPCAMQVQLFFRLRLISHNSADNRWVKGFPCLIPGHEFLNWKPIHSLGSLKGICEGIHTLLKLMYKIVPAHSRLDLGECAESCLPLYSCASVASSYELGKLL